MAVERLGDKFANAGAHGFAQYYRIHGLMKANDRNVRGLCLNHTHGRNRIFDGFKAEKDGVNRMHTQRPREVGGEGVLVDGPG